MLPAVPSQTAITRSSGSSKIRRIPFARAMVRHSSTTSWISSFPAWLEGRSPFLSLRRVHGALIAALMMSFDQTEPTVFSRQGVPARHSFFRGPTQLLASVPGCSHPAPRDEWVRRRCGGISLPREPSRLWWWFRAALAPGKAGSKIS